MRRLLPLLLFSLSAIPFCGNAQHKHVELSTGYNAAMPVGDMQQHANTVHSFNLQGLYLLPGVNRLGIGLEFRAGTYAAFTRQQEFGMNGTTTMTDVHYNSNVTSGNVVVRYDIIRANNLSVFGGLKGGVTDFNSKFQIEDPQDPDGCHPLQTQELMDSYTWQAGANTGVHMDMRAIFPRMPKNLLLLQGYVGFMYGGNVDYINVRHLTHEDDMHTNPPVTGEEGGTPVSVRFINMDTGDIHEHEVARAYNSPVRFMEAGVSLVVRL